MKNFLYILFLNQIFFIYSPIPNWDINGISVNLFSSSSSQSTFSYVLYNNYGLILTKKITKNADGTLSSQNYLTNNSVTKAVPFEGIESFNNAQLGCYELVCPKGSFHPFCFDSNSYIIPSGYVSYGGNWELSCYKHDTGYFLVFYAHNGNNTLYYAKGDNRDFKIVRFFEELYSYKLPEYQNLGHNYQYKFPSLQKRHGNLVFSGFNLLMNSADSTINCNQVQGSTTLIEAKAYTQGSIDSNYYFYYFTYNNVSDFSSGYSNHYMDLSQGSYPNSFSATNNIDNSPLTFIDNVEIKEINFIQGTEYVYYKIYNKDKETTYYGLINIKLNKVIYNLESENNATFIPDTTGNMLLITSTDMYRVCMVKSTLSNYCDDPAWDAFLLDPDGNKYDSTCDNDKIKMMPENICIRRDLCDLNYYILNVAETECGLCSYFYPKERKYKLINTTGCLSEIPNNAEYYNPQWFLLKCKVNYHLENNECKPDLFNNTLINIIKECPFNNDENLKNYCINLTNNVTHYSNSDLVIVSSKTDNTIIRAYSSDNKNNELKYYDNKSFKVNISLCEQKLKEYYNISQNESIIIYDINNINNDIYLYKILSPKGEELSLNICTINNISINIINYYSKKGLNQAKCPEKFPYYNKNNDKCLKYCDIDNYLTKTCITDNINNENKEKNIINIKNSLKSNLIASLLDNITSNTGQEVIIEEDGISYHLTSSANQNYKIYKNISNIYLGKCEEILKNKYNINSDKSLLIFKVDIYIKGYNAPIVEYEVYHPITKEKLDLNFCDEEKIKISKPVNKDIKEKDIKKYEQKSEFYNDICSTYKSKFNTDITLKDRQNEFINNNMSLCEDNCDFISYNISLKKVDCICHIKNKIRNLFEAKFDMNKIKNKFDFRNMINIEVIKCYKKLFCKDGILYNIGSYILLSIILIFIIGLIIFINKEFKSLQKEIEINIIIENKNENNNDDNEKIKGKELITQKNDNKNAKILKKSREVKVRKEKLKIKNDSTIRLKGKTISNSNNKEKELDFKINNTNIIVEKNEKLEINNIKEKKVFTDYELNKCSYKEAIQYDKRTFFEYFFSLIKINHILLFALIPSKDYNSKIIKFCLFLFSFSLNLTIEALFYNEEVMHNIYEIEGIYDIIGQISQIIYSSIISTLINIIIKYFALSQKYVIQQKNNKSDENTVLKLKRMINILIKKFILFYVFCFILLFFSWYYISCFCAIFSNTQVHLIKDVLIGFGLSLIYPIISYLFSGIFRFIAFKNENKFIYKFSNLIVI